MKEFKWNLWHRINLPEHILDDMHLWQLKDNQFVQLDADISNQDRDRITLLSMRADCMERASQLIGRYRFNKSNNMFGAPQITEMYRKEISDYNQSKRIGPLLNSLVDNPSQLPTVVDELDTKIKVYDGVLLMSEMKWNELCRSINASTDPFATMSEWIADIRSFA
jgi:hypothetical protein